MRGRIAATLGILLLLCCNHAHAVITAKTPLAKFEGDAVYIVVGKVDKFYPEKPAMLVAVTEDIKGKAPFRQLPINLKVTDPKVVKDNHIEPLLKRFGSDQEIIFFIDRNNKTLISFAFTNGTWFHLLGKQVGGKEDVAFSLKSAEPYFRKAFRGTTAELRKLLKDHAAGKAKLPDIDDKVPPGFGPEYQPMKKSQRPHLLDAWIALTDSPRTYPQGSLFAVIPTLGIGAPLAILALLFPTVFGGVFVLFRQWMAFITVISLNSTLMLLHIWLAPKFLRGSFWSTDSALWIVMTGCTFACLVWAWHRQLSALAAGDREGPCKTELLILLFMTISCGGTAIVLWFTTKQVSWADAGWTLSVVLSLSVLAGTLHRAFHMVKKQAMFGPPPLTTEGVILSTMLLGHLAFVPAIWGSNVTTEGKIDFNESAGQTSAKVSPVVQKWDFTVEPRIRGMYAANPVLDGDAIYASFSRTSGTATLVRLDRQTGTQKWDFFGKDDDLRQMISTPCLADGKLYFGEGFHFDLNCHVFCVDADKGEEVWRFKTAGQTESSPAVANGKVYIGAGNDGIYCLSAKTGEPHWHFHREATARLLRFGGGMVLVGNRLYCGTGEDREQKIDKGETAAFCFDAATGKEIWRTPTPYAVWSTPVVKDGMVFITSGNGDVFEDAKPPAIPGGALQCLDAKTGKELWSIKLDNGVIEAPAVDAHRIYFTCRNGNIYCVSRADGKERWKYWLESPLIAAPILDMDPVYERTVSVFVTTTAGKVCCMNPQTGDILWHFTPKEPATIATSPCLVVTRTPDGYRRQLYFGCGLGGGSSNTLINRPVFYCLEDKLRVE